MLTKDLRHIREKLPARGYNVLICFGVVVLVLLCGYPLYDAAQSGYPKCEITFYVHMICK